MKFLTKARKKWIISIIVLGLATFFNVKEIPIQDNYVVIIEVVFAAIFGGYWLKLRSEK
jgi:hypothetical protein